MSGSQDSASGDQTNALLVKQSRESHQPSRDHEAMGNRGQADQKMTLLADLGQFCENHGHARIAGTESARGYIGGHSKASSDTSISSQMSSPPQKAKHKPQSAKDVADVHLRSLELENSKLKTENKIIKEKCNIAACDIKDLQDQLLSKQETLNTLQTKFPQEVFTLYKKSRSDLEGEVEQLHSKICQLTHTNTSLKTQAEEYEKLLHESKELDRKLMNSGTSQTVASYKNESAFLKEQVQSLTELLKESEEDLQREAVQRCSGEEQLVNMQKMFAELSKHGSSDSSAKKVGLQQLREELEAKRGSMEEKMENIKAEKDAATAVFHQQLADLVKEKHETSTRLKSMEDLVGAVCSENEVLRKSISADNSDLEQLQQQEESHEKLQSMELELHSRKTYDAQVQRTVQMMREENRALRLQLEACERALEEALGESQSIALEEDQTSSLREQIAFLNSELTGLRAELQVMTDRCTTLGAEKTQLTIRLEEVNFELSHLRAQTRDNHAAEAVENKKIQRLEAALEMKDTELVKISTHFQELSFELQRMKDINQYNQDHMDELENQLEDVRHQLKERSKLVSAATNKEKEQMDHIFILKETIDYLTHELNQKNNEFKTLTMELSQERDRNERFERQFGQMVLDLSNHAADADSQMQLNVSRNAGGGSNQPSNNPTPSTSFSITFKLHDLEGQRDRLKDEIKNFTIKIKTLESDYETARRELSKVTQNLVQEKSLTCKVSADKLDLESQLREVMEERDILARQKNRAEADLDKLERKLEELMSRFEEEACRATRSIQSDGVQFSIEPKKMEIELHHVHAFMEEKDKEIEMLKDKIRRQETEHTFLARRVEMLKKENADSKEDINRLTQDLMTKMQENWAVFEMNQGLVRERHELQKQIETLQMQLTCEREYSDKRSKEFEQTIRQVETEKERVETQKTKIESEKMKIESEKIQILHEKTENEANIGNNASQMEAEMEDLRKVNQGLQRQIAELNQQIDDMQQDLADTQRSAAKQAKAGNTEQHLKEAFHMIEELRKDRQEMLKCLSEEKKITASFQEETGRHEASIMSLSERMNELIQACDLVESKLSSVTEKLQQCEKEKAVITQEYEAVAGNLQEAHKEIEKKLQVITQKDSQIQQQREEAEKTISFKNEEIAMLKKESETTAAENERLRKKAELLEEQSRELARTKELLAASTKQAGDMQTRVEQLEVNARESLILMESLRSELVSLNEANSELQEQLTKSQAATEQEKHRRLQEKEEYKANITELNHTIAQIRATSECEHRMLQETINRVEASQCHAEEQLTRCQLSLNESVVEVRSLTREKQELYCKLQAENARLQELQTALDNARAEMDTSRNRKHQTEEALMETEAALSKFKENFQTEQKMRIRFFQEKQQLELLREDEAKLLRQKAEENIVLKNEVAQLQQLLDEQKSHLEARRQKSLQEMRSQFDNVSQEKVKISQQAHKLSIELEQNQEQIAIKNRESVQLQEQMLLLESKLREAESRFRAADEALKMESDLQHRLNIKFQEQEEEIRRLRGFLKKKLEADADLSDKEHWHEMQKMIMDLMNTLNKRGTDTGGEEATQKQLAELECKLTTERRLHDITKSSLQTLEADCARLRKQMHQLHRKGLCCDSNFNSKQAKRMDEINDIISRCQSRAQAVMSTELYTDGTLRYLSPTKDYNLTPARPFSVDASVSSDCSISSHRSFPVSSAVPSHSYNPGF